MELPKVIKTYLGSKVYYTLTIIIMSIAGYIGFTEYVVTQQQFKNYQDKEKASFKAYQKEQQINNAFYELKLIDLESNSLKTDLYQLKKMKKNRIADEDDIERIDEIKDRLKVLDAKKDSLEQFIKNNKKD